MCSICHRSPCSSRCPNAEEPEVLYKCALCNEGIEEGEEFIRYEGSYYHAECIGSLSADKIARIFLNTRVLIAGED
jgi:hypothetical protein